jgi:hypothetical protein
MLSIGERTVNSLQEVVPLAAADRPAAHATGRRAGATRPGSYTPVGILVTRKHRVGREASRSAPGAAPRRLLAVVIVVAVAGVLGWVTWRSPASSTPSAGTAAPQAPRESSSPAQYAALIGSWVRPDGGYQLYVSAVSTDGTATVAYFNPQPIPVARAEARQDGSHVGLFVEFDHPNYPGSTYTLVYDPARDTLRGIYYQAVQRASYDVEFVRRR